MTMQNATGERSAMTIGDDGSTIYKREGIDERESVRENGGEREEKRIS